MAEIALLDPGHSVKQPSTFFTGWSTSAKELFAGACGGCVSVIAGHPLDTVRVRQQQLGQPTITMLSKLSSMVRTEGVLSPYKGLSYPLYSSALQSAVMFWSYGYALRLLQPDVRKDTHSDGDSSSSTGGSSSNSSSRRHIPPHPSTISSDSSHSSEPAHTSNSTSSKSSPTQQPDSTVSAATSTPDSPAIPSLNHVLLAGCFSGLAQFAFMTPIDVLKIRMQVQTTPPGTAAYLGPLRMVKHIVTREGMRGLFRGITITALRDVPCFAMYFAAYTATTQAAQSLPSFSWPGQSTHAEGKSCKGSEDVSGMHGSGSSSSSSSVSPAQHQREGHSLGSQHTEASGDDGLRHRNSGNSNTGMGHQGASGSGVSDGGNGNSSSSRCSSGSDSGGHGESMAIPSLLSSGATQLLAGGAAGALSWLCIYPLDVIKSRMQAGSPCSPPGSSWLQVARNIHQHGSAKAFTRGLGTTLWRAVLVNAACFAGYEQVMAVLNTSGQKN